MRVGLDIGSTTIKCVVLDSQNNIIYKSYERHYSKITEKTAELLKRIADEVLVSTNGDAQLVISGSAGMGLAEASSIPFVQEVFATRVASKKLFPNADVIIELGGEDAKILFLTNGMEVRMNGSCAGGTGAFIDQMATLLNITPEKMNVLAAEHDKIYTVASRCGVFAKSDIQPLLNQGARKSDISASIFFAVVNQTIAGLAQGRPIQGNVVYLGGPLSFLSELRNCFDETLGISGTCPENSLYYVAIGASLCADSDGNTNLYEAAKRVENHKGVIEQTTMKPLFNNEEEYKEFKERHNKASIKISTLPKDDTPVYLGIDAGSTTVKSVIIDKDGNLLYSKYQSNSGNPVPLIKDFLQEVYEENPNINIACAATTGYGEEILKNAFSIDYGIVETIAHLTAAERFMPDVQFVIDIGGQDIKCFQIEDGVIDNIFLNEACSSGCGSFLQTFANALDYPIDDFASLGLFAKKPVDLGSRCTVFMNSSVKQAQKDGATIEDISAGLSISVVKNALYKVIRATSSSQLGKNIVVQGGTFLNDAVLRAFEQELDIEAVRPNIAGLMGAYGAALYALSQGKTKSDIITKEGIKNFTHEVKVINCGLCSNNCKLTVNIFENNRKYIGGNRCEKPVAHKVDGSSEELNIYQYKLDLLGKYKPQFGKRGKIGIPMGLNMYELLPFYYTLLTELGFEVITSETSNRSLYLSGQNTIPSDTVCYPAKLMHGHIKSLLNKGIDTIFYPCMTYNIDEGKSDNHYNCPVVAYYPEVLQANMPELRDVTFIHDYLGIDRRKDFPHKFKDIMSKYFDDIKLSDVKKACDKAYEEYNWYFESVREKGSEIIEKARQQGKQIIVLSGRPYHIDPEINHGIDKLILSCGAAIISEDSLSYKAEKFHTTVLNQWTYHARLYSAARVIKDGPDMNLVQLVSFGCGVDAITTDEIREILEGEGKIYTQIKIDEITNLGAVKIRLRSLFAALEQMGGKAS